LNHSGVFHDVLIFLLAAVVIVPLFHRLHTSPILGYLVAGILIGPYGFSIIGDTQSAHTLAEFGVVFLLFMIGLDLSLKRLRAMGQHVFGLGLLQVLVTGLLIGLISWSMGFEVKAAAIVGGALALSSTAFVLQLLAERGERASDFGYFSFSILLLQDLAVVPLLIMVTTFSQDGTSFVTAFGQAMLKAAIALIVVTWAGRLILRPVFHMISSARSAELFVAATLLAVLGTGWLLSLTGLSLALGAFLAGLLLAETEYRHQVEADIRPFRGLLLGLFFMTIGMTINIGFILAHLELIAFLVLALLVGKTIITSLLCRAFRIATDISLKVGLALSQGGEFGFVIFGAAGTLNLIPMETVQILLAVIALSMAATPGLVYIGDQLSNRLKGAPGNITDRINAEFKADKKNVLIAGFGRVGQTIAKLLSDGDIPYVAIDLDHNRVAECRARGMPVYYGDASQISVLNAAGAKCAAAIVITLDQVSTVNHIVLELRKNHPEAQIFVRARDMLHLRKLETGGATAIIPETAEASLALGAIIMNSLGIEASSSATIIETYRENDYAQLGDIVTRLPKTH
jgi:CPA2 family monovalent cation:H+ antiporter-2